MSDEVDVAPWCTVCKATQARLLWRSAACADHYWQITAHFSNDCMSGARFALIPHAFASLPMSLCTATFLNGYTTSSPFMPAAAVQLHAFLPIAMEDGLTVMQGAGISLVSMICSALLACNQVAGT